MAAVWTGKMNKWGFVEMCGCISEDPEEMHRQTRFVS